MKHNRCRSLGKPRVSPTVFDRLNPNVAGIDCGLAEHFVAVPPDRDATPVQSFTTFTSDLLRLADWLIACRVTSVAMEATGVYWIPIYEILEARGLEVLLVNARHLKNVPGRKSDVSDCEWIRELHSVGLLRGSFRPTEAIVALRAYLRHRQTLVESAGTYIQRMQKALVPMNLQLPLVVSNITGVTGLRILRDIVAGQRDPQQLAEHRDHPRRAPGRTSGAREPAGPRERAKGVGSIWMLCRDSDVVVEEFRGDVGPVCPDQRVKLWMNLKLSEGLRISQGLKDWPFQH
jgi:Transposase